MKDHRAVREQVRLLWIANGGNLTAAAAAANVPIDRAEKWKERGKWNQIQHPEARQILMSENVGATADCLASELESNGKETRLKLSRYAKKQAEHLANDGKLKDHLAFKNIAAGANTLHGYNEAKAGQNFTLNVLNMGDLAIQANDSGAD